MTDERNAYPHNCPVCHVTSEGSDTCQNRNCKEARKEHLSEAQRKQIRDEVWNYDRQN